MLLLSMRSSMVCVLKNLKVLVQSFLSRSHAILWVLSESSKESSGFCAP